MSACWALGSWPGSSLVAHTCNGNHTWLEFSLLDWPLPIPCNHTWLEFSLLNWPCPYLQSHLADISLLNQPLPIPAITPSWSLACLNQPPTTNLQSHTGWSLACQTGPCPYLQSHLARGRLTSDTSGPPQTSRSPYTSPLTPVL